MRSGAPRSEQPVDTSGVRSRPTRAAGPADPPPVAELWDEYKTHGALEARERLILHYAPLAKVVADHMTVWPPQVDRADLASFGLFGLIDAIEKFDPGRGFKFETYAISRIKGAILDELRSLDWVPRRVRQGARAIGDVRTELESTLCRSPSHAEIAAAIGIRPDQLDRARSASALARTVSLDDPTAADGPRGTGAIPVAEMIPDPADHFESLISVESMASAIAKVPDRGRLVLTLYYFEGLTLAEIGAVLGVTESRVCQIHTKALAELRRRVVMA
jgi:RNA polymerase sigma factor for flagellar operon FliA